jgi:hypothetical protein
LHHGLLLHSSPPNRSDSPRRTIAFGYRSALARQLAGPNFRDTGLLVHGPVPTTIECQAVRWNQPLAGELRRPRSRFARGLGRIGVGKQRSPYIQI